MVDETDGAASPADEQAVTAPAEGEQAETTSEAKPETEEATEKTETTEEQTEGDESSSDDKPRKASRSERMRRRMAAMATELDSLRARLDEGRAQTEQSAKDTAPKEADFNGDYFAFQAAKAAHDARQAVRAEFLEREQREITRKLVERQREATEEFFDRAEEIKPRVPDFDATLQKYWDAGGRFAPHVSAELRESDRGPELTYYLAKNPGVAAELNALPPIEAAKELVRLESKVSLSTPKKQTQAPPPVKPASGGATPSRDLHQLADSDMDAFVKLRNKQDAERRRNK